MGMAESVSEGRRWGLGLLDLVTNEIQGEISKKNPDLPLFGAT